LYSVGVLGSAATISTHGRPIGKLALQIRSRPSPLPYDRAHTRAPRSSSSVIALLQRD
jgi:hypothetical protein